MPSFKIFYRIKHVSSKNRHQEQLEKLTGKQLNNNWKRIKKVENHSFRGYRIFVTLLQHEKTKL